MSFMEKLKKGFKEQQTAYKQKAAANSLIKKKARVAYLKERERQELRVARERAKFEANTKIKRMKSKTQGHPFGLSSQPKAQSSPRIMGVGLGSGSIFDNPKEVSPKKAIRKTRKPKKRKVVMYI